MQESARLVNELNGISVAPRRGLRVSVEGLQFRQRSGAPSPVAVRSDGPLNHGLGSVDVTENYVRAKAL